MAEKTPPPPGRRPLQINNKQMDKYELKTGPGRKDTVTHKLFVKTEMLCVAANAPPFRPCTKAAQTPSFPAPVFKSAALSPPPHPHPHKSTLAAMKSTS